MLPSPRPPPRVSTRCVLWLAPLHARLWINIILCARTPPTRRLMAVRLQLTSPFDAERVIFDKQGAMQSPAFGIAKQMDSVQGAVAGLSAPVLYGLSALVVAGGLGVGAVVGGQAPGAITFLRLLSSPPRT